MRDSYTVTLPEEPPALPDLHKELRPRASMPGSLLVSTFVGLVLNKTKVRARSLGGTGGGDPCAPRGAQVPPSCPSGCPSLQDGGRGAGTHGCHRVLAAPGGDPAAPGAAPSRGQEGR